MSWKWFGLCHMLDLLGCFLVLQFDTFVDVCRTRVVTAVVKAAAAAGRFEYLSTRSTYYLPTYLIKILLLLLLCGRVMFCCCCEWCRELVLVLTYQPKYLPTYLPSILVASSASLYMMSIHPSSSAIEQYCNVSCCDSIHYPIHIW